MFVARNLHLDDYQVDFFIVQPGIIYSEKVHEAESGRSAKEHANKLKVTILYNHISEMTSYHFEVFYLWAAKH